MAQKRAFFKDDVRNETYISLSDKSKVLLWDIKANTDDYGFIRGMTMPKMITGATDENIKELVQAGYLYDFGNKNYLYRWFQKDNSLQYVKTQQTVCPVEITYIYLNSESQYMLSAVPIRKYNEWTGKIKHKAKNKDTGKIEEVPYENKDKVVPAEFLEENKIEKGYKIIHFDMSLPWSEHEKVAKDYLVSQGINPETDKIKKEEAPSLASSTSFTSDNESEQNEVKANPYLQVGAPSDTEDVSDDLPF